MKKGCNKMLILSSLFMVLVVSFVFAGGKAEKEKVAKEVILTIPMLEWPPTDITKELTPEFEKKTGIKVRYDVLPWETCHEKITMELSAGNSTYDVMTIDHTWNGQYIRGGHLMPLPWKEWKEDPEFDYGDIISAFIEAYGSPFGKPGEIYAYPFTTDARLIFYRKDLFSDPKYKAEFKQKYGRELRPAITWVEYLDLAKFFTRDRDGDGKIDLYGTTMMGSKGFSACTDFVIQLYGRGGDLLDSKTLKPVFNSPEGVEALKFYVDLYRTYKVVAPDSINYQLDETASQMQMDRAAMIDTWMTFWPRFQDNEKSLVVGKVEAATLPQDPKGYPRTPLGGWSLAISNYSKHKEESLAYFKWFLSKETQKKYAQKGGGSCRYSVLLDPEIVKMNPYFPVVAESLKYGKPFSDPVLPEHMEIWNIISEHVQYALLGKVSPKEALDAAAAKVENLLLESGYYE